MSEIGNGGGAPAAPIAAPSIAPALGVQADAPVNDSAGSSFARAVTGSVNSNDAAVFDRLYGAPASPAGYELNVGEHNPTMEIGDVSKLNAAAQGFLHSIGLSAPLGARLVDTVMKHQTHYDQMSDEQRQLWQREQGQRLRQLYGDDVAKKVDAADEILIGKGDGEFLRRYRGGLLSAESVGLLIEHANRVGLRKTMGGGS